DNRGKGPENLDIADLHICTCCRDKGRSKEETLTLLFSIDVRFCTFLFRVFQNLLKTIEKFFLRNRSYIGLLIHRIPDLQFLHFKLKCLDEVNHNVFNNNKALGSNTALSGIKKSRFYSYLRSPLDVSILKYYKRI